MFFLRARYKENCCQELIFYFLRTVFHNFECYNLEITLKFLLLSSDISRYKTELYKHHSKTFCCDVYCPTSNLRNKILIYTIKT